MKEKSKNSTRYTSEMIQLVWEKGHVVEGRNSSMYRRDHCGALIRRDMYGKCTDALSMGWEIDKIKPQEQGGDSGPCNLQPLQWVNKKSKEGQYPSWSCVVTSAGLKNVRLVAE